jgi:hypothetical protein
MACPSQCAKGATLLRLARLQGSQSFSFCRVREFSSSHALAVDYEWVSLTDGISGSRVAIATSSQNCWCCVTTRSRPILLALGGLDLVSDCPSSEPRGHSASHRSYDYGACGAGCETPGSHPCARLAPARHGLPLAQTPYSPRERRPRPGSRSVTSL